jgi:hypothetical protein
LLPTVTVKVVALATVGRKARDEAIITTTTAKQREEVLVGLVTPCTLQTIYCRTQSWKSDAVVTFSGFLQGVYSYGAVSPFR